MQNVNIEETLGGLSRPVGGDDGQLVNGPFAKSVKPETRSKVTTDIHRREVMYYVLSLDYIEKLKM